MTTNPVLTRISKLLQRTEGRGCTEAEAGEAAAKVQELLQEHNLTLSQVEASGGNSAHEQRELAKTNRPAMFSWQRELMGAVADNHFCLHRVARVFEKAGTVLWTGDLRRESGYSQQHQVVGRAVNVQATQMMYDYLVEAINHAARDSGMQGLKAMQLFKSGAVDRLAARLRERREEQERQSRAAAAKPTGNGTHRELVLSDVYGTEADLNNDHLNNFPPGTTAVNRQKANERAKLQKAEHDRLVNEEGLDSDEAWYRAYGYGEKEAAQAVTRWRRGHGGRGRSQGWTASERREARRRGSEEFKAGRVAGSQIGLDAQVGSASRLRIPR